MVNQIKVKLLGKKMLNFTQYIIEAVKKPAVAVAPVSNDDKGKLHELLLAKHLHPKKALPEHWRSESENEEHAGTPEQVHSKLQKKVGPEVYKQIDSHAKQTAASVIKHMEDNGHIHGKTGTKITNVHWTSNRDTEKKAGDHERTTGVKDTKSNADLILTTEGNGKKVFHGISAKYGSHKPNYANPGLNSLEKMSGVKPGSLQKHQKEHEASMEKLGYTGTRKQRKAAYKTDVAARATKPNSVFGKRATAAEGKYLETKKKITRSIEKGLSTKSHNEILNTLTDIVAPKTHINHIVAHSQTKPDGSAVSQVDTPQNIVKKKLSQFKNLRVSKGSGTNATIVGDVGGKQRSAATINVKGQSGPHAGTLGAIKLR